MPPDGRLEQAGLGAFGIGEGPGLKAKQLGLQHGLRDGGAVDVEEGPLGTRAAVVDDARHQPLAGAGLPLQQHRGDGGIPQRIKGGEVADLGAQGREGGAVPTRRSVGWRGDSGWGGV